MSSLRRTDGSISPPHPRTGCQLGLRTDVSTGGDNRPIRSHLRVKCEVGVGGDQI